MYFYCVKPNLLNGIAPFTKQQYKTLKDNIGYNIMANTISKVDDNIVEK